MIISKYRCDVCGHESDQPKGWLRIEIWDLGPAVPKTHLDCCGQNCALRALSRAVHEMQAAAVAMNRKENKE